MNLPKVQNETQEESLWSSCPVYDVDMVLPNRYGPYSAFSLLYCDLYLRDFKESLKHTMLDQESVFEDQIHELHRLYRRQKDLMMEMEETNNLYSQPQNVFLDAGVTSPTRSMHWMGSCISTSKASVFPPEEAFSKINEAGISGDESDKSGEKVLDLELPFYGYLDIGEEEEEGSKNGEVLNFPKDQSPRIMSLESIAQPENLQLLTGLARSKCIVDLNEPVKIEEHSDYELNPFLNPAQTRSERAEPEAQVLQISTKSQAENGIDLNMSPLSPEEELTIIKTRESEQPREFVPASLHGKHRSEPSRSIVQALPSSRTISLYHKRWSGPRKKAKRRAKSTNVGTFPRSKAQRGSNIDSNFGIHEDDNHSLSTSSYIPESDHSQKYPEKRSLSSLLEMKSGRSWANTGKRRRRRQQIEESGKVMREISRTKSKTRGSFLVTEEVEQEKSAAEAIVDMSSSDSPRKSSIKTSDCITPLHWFAKIASSVDEDSKSKVGLSVTEFYANYQIDYFEAMTLQLTEMEAEEQRTSTSVSNIFHPKHKRTRRSKGKRQQLHKDGDNEFLPSLRTFAGSEASQDLQKIGRLMEASETNDAHSSYNSLMENMRFDWGSIRKRRRGIRIRAATTKTCRAFLQVPF